MSGLPQIEYWLLNIIINIERANTDGGVEEYRSANLERECSEEICNYQEAFEIFENRDETEQFLAERTNQCERQNPCFPSGSQVCENKWNDYWCECLSGWFGKNCDYIEIHGELVCQNLNGCAENLEKGRPATDSKVILSEDDVISTKAPPPIIIPDDIMEKYEPRVFCDMNEALMKIQMPQGKRKPSNNFMN